MTPWHRFWFPDDQASRRVPRDAALWSPDALAELQQSFWHQAVEATAQWWRFVSVAWPGVPVQPTAGHVVQAAPQADLRRRPTRPAIEPRPAHAPPRTPRKTSVAAKRPRVAARGK